MTIPVGRWLGTGLALLLFPLAPTVAQGTDQTVFSWDAFGVGYAYFIASAVVAGLLYMFFRWQIVLNPGAVTRRYSVAIQVIGLLYVIAAILGNRITGVSAYSLPYESLPLMGFVIIVHYLAHREQQPAVLIFALSLVISIFMVGFVSLSMGWLDIRPAQWVIGAVCAGLVGYTLVQCARTKKSYVGRANVARKVTIKGAIPDVRAWLSLEQWVGLAVASLVVATIAQMLGGSSLLELPATDILVHALAVLGATLIIGIVYTGLHWLLTRSVGGDLVWVVWIVWILVAFASAYGMFLTGKSA